jgi:hypothetical protein
MSGRGVPQDDALAFNWMKASSATGCRLKSFWIATANSTIANLAATLATTEVEDQSGKPADEFRCDLILTIGDKLSE